MCVSFIKVPEIILNYSLSHFWCTAKLQIQGTKSCQLLLSRSLMNTPSINQLIPPQRLCLSYAYLIDCFLGF